MRHKLRRFERLENRHLMCAESCLPGDNIAGDVNLDGAVSFADFLILSANFGNEGDVSQGDTNGDGRIDFADFLDLSSNFGKTRVSKPLAATQILFLSDRPGGNRDGNWDLYRAQLDGSSVEQITDFEDRSVRWFDLHKPSGVIVLAGSQRGDLSIGPSGQDGGPADAEEFIAVRDLDGDVTILIDVLDESSNPEGFTSVWHPTISPDGVYLVFAAARADESMNLWGMRVDGTELTHLSPDPHRTQNDPRFTADGRVVYVRHNQTGIGQLIDLAGFDTWVIDPQNPRNNERLTLEGNIFGPPQPDTDPAISPDGQWVVTSRAVSLFPPTNALSIMRADAQSSEFADTLTSNDTNGLLGVATWIDNDELLSYAWNQKHNGWQVIRFNRNHPGDFSFVSLEAPEGYRDLLPLAY